MDYPEHTRRIFSRGVARDEAGFSSGVVNEPEGINIFEDFGEVLEDEGGGHGLDLRDLLLSDPEG